MQNWQQLRSLSDSNECKNIRKLRCVQRATLFNTFGNSFAKYAINIYAAAAATT